MCVMNGYRHLIGISQSLEVNNRIAFLKIKSEGDLTLGRNNFAYQDCGSGFDAFLGGIVKKVG